MWEDYSSAGWLLWAASCAHAQWQLFIDFQPERSSAVLRWAEREWSWVNAAAAAAPKQSYTKTTTITSSASGAASSPCSSPPSSRCSSHAAIAAKQLGSCLGGPLTSRWNLLTMLYGEFSSLPLPPCCCWRRNRKTFMFRFCDVMLLLITLRGQRRGAVSFSSSLCDMSLLLVNNFCFIIWKLENIISFVSDFFIV